MKRLKLLFIIILIQTLFIACSETHSPFQTPKNNSSEEAANYHENRENDGSGDNNQQNNSQRRAPLIPSINRTVENNSCSFKGHECEEYLSAICKLSKDSNKNLKKGDPFKSLSYKGKSCFSSRDDFMSKLPDHVKSLFAFMAHSGAETEESTPSYGSPQFGRYLDPKLMHIDLKNGDTYSVTGHCKDKKACGYEVIERCIKTHDQLDWVCFTEEHTKTANGKQFIIKVDPKSESAPSLDGNIVAGKKCSECHGGHLKSRLLIGAYGKWDGWYSGLAGIESTDEVDVEKNLIDGLMLRPYIDKITSLGKEAQEIFSSIPDNLTEAQAYQLFACRHDLVSIDNDKKNDNMCVSNNISSFAPSNYAKVDSTAYDHLISSTLFTKGAPREGKQNYEFRSGLAYGKSLTIATGYFSLQHSKTLFERMNATLVNASELQEKLFRESLMAYGPNFNCEKSEPFGRNNLKNRIKTALKFPKNPLNVLTRPSMFEQLIRQVKLEPSDFNLTKNFADKKISAQEAMRYNAASDEMHQLFSFRNLLNYIDNYPENSFIKEVVNNLFLPEIYIPLYAANNPEVNFFKSAKEAFNQLNKGSYPYKENPGLLNEINEQLNLKGPYTNEQSWANFLHRYAFSDYTDEVFEEVLSLPNGYLVKAVAPGLQYTIFKPYLETDYFIEVGNGINQGVFTSGLNKRDQVCEIITEVIESTLCALGSPCKKPNE